ncbi:MAG TPA: DUF72 domain-containing protein [Tepidisphaeraceae bacterium]|jgi:uncharacterized protein YecE (DUF72 family)|nr:DUF72 domain-containing protein [Tepidisphaeraceae bacterium]
MKLTRPKSAISPEQRRQRRAERREKQRAANAGRALKMHALRVAEERQMCLAPTNRLSMERELPRLNIGCSGWFYWDWKDRFYPAGMMTKDWFHHYANHFETVELNAPFYSWPTLATVQTWLRQVQGRPFVYTVKVCELITHVKRFARTAELVKDFCFIGQLLDRHMGCFLFQLPPSFHYTAARLKRILDQLDPSLRNVVEFRHASWWNKQTMLAFRKTGTIFCSCSAPRLPDELVDTGGEVYLRFHGTKNWYRHNYTPDELAVWTKRILDQNPSRVWAYFNNDHGGNAIANARELSRQLAMNDAL